MNKRICYYLHGLNEFQKPILKRVAEHRHISVLEEVTEHPEDAKKLREEYCALKCEKQQICKFLNRYGGWYESSR